MNRMPPPVWGTMAFIAACASGGPPVTTPPPEVAAADSAIRSAIANERSIDASSFPTATVGVAPFRILTTDSSLAVLGFGLADLLITDLSRSAQLRVVDRLRIDALVREMGLMTTGYVDSSAGPRFGRIVGARRIVLGSLTTVDPERVRLDGHVGDVVTGVVGATEPAPARLDEVLDAEKTFAFAVFDRLGVALAPAERALVEQRPTRNLAALLAFSRGVRSEVTRDYAQASREYREALRLDANFGSARANLDRVETQIGAGGGGAPFDLFRVGALVLEGVNAAAMPRISSAADPSFRQPLSTTVIIILNLP